MNSWNQTQNQNYNYNTVGTAQFTPYNNNIWGQYQTAQPQRAPVYRADPIHGENAAWQFPIGGGEIYLPDADEDIIWWIRVDQNGNKSVTPFDVSLHKKPDPINMDEILARLGAVEEWINGKSNKSNAKRNNNAPTVAATSPTEPVN